MRQYLPTKSTLAKKRWPIQGILAFIFCITGYISYAQQTYYARVNGNWATAATWSTSSCSGVAATSTPGASDNVVICATRTVTWSTSGGSTTIANLTVSSGGVLSVTGNSNIYVNSFVLDGTVNGNGQGDIRMGNVAGSTLSGSGTFATTSTSGNLRLQNNVTILVGTDIKFNNNGRFSLNGRTATNNGKISILNPSNFTGGGTFVNNAATSYFLYTKAGNFPTSTRLTATAVGNTVEFGPVSNTRNMDAQGSYYHLILSGKTSRQNVTTMTIAGNLTIASGAAFNTNTGTRSINIYGDWINNLGGSFIRNTSTVRFSGTSNNQTLSPPAGGTGETFYNLTINNTFAGGQVTATGNVTMTASRLLLISAGIFDMSTYTLGGGAANLTMTGGELRMAKLSTVLPELTGTYNITGGTIRFYGSGNQGVRSLNTSPATYYHIAFSGSGNRNLAGDISVKGNWTNSGTTTVGNFTTSFIGSTLQTVTNTAGESLYRVAKNGTGTLTLESSTDLTVVNGLTMTSGNVNLNGRMLTLGAAVASTLSRAAGICYGGTFRRYFPVTAITSNSGSYYGLFPVGTPLNYRPVQITSTANPTTAGYVSVMHNDATTATDVAYSDNEGTAIQRVTDMNDDISTTLLAGGTYTLSVTMNSLSSMGVLTDLRLETQDGPPYGVGTSLPNGGTVAAPVVSRSTLDVAKLNHTFVIGTRDRSATPMVASYYSRKTGNWNDIAAAGTWSLTNGGPACLCQPISSSIVYINSTHSVTLNAIATVDFITVRTGGILLGSSNFTVNYDLTTIGTGRIAPTAGAWTIGRDLTIAGTSASTSAASIAVAGDLDVDASNSLLMTNTLSVAGDLTVDGTLGIGASSLTLTGANAVIAGSGGAANITGTGTITMTQPKTINSGATLIVQPNVSLSAATTITNLGSISIAGNLTGANATTSVWVNGTNSTLNVAGTVLTTGALDLSGVPNTVNYNGSGAQTVKVPLTSYSELILSNAGLKTVAGDIVVDNDLIIQDAAIFNTGTNTLGGTGDLVMTDHCELRIGKTTAGTYPELTGSYQLSGGTVTLNQNSSNAFDVRAVDYYNLFLNGSGAAIYDFTGGGNITNDMTVALAGTSRIRTLDAPLTVAGDLVFNNTSTVASILNNDVAVGSLTLNTGLLTTSGTFTLQINEAGGWVKNGGTFTADANLNTVFAGSVDQAIGGSSSTTFTNLEIVNSGPTGVVVSRSFNVTGILTFTEGNFVTTSTALPTLTATASITGVSDDSFIDGPIQKTGATDFVFPVGKDGQYRPISATGLTSSGTFLAEYFHSNPGTSYNLTLKDATLTRLQTSEYWILNITAGTPTAVVTLSWDSYSGTVNDLNNLKVARWNGAMWKDHGNGGTIGAASPATGTIRTSGVVTAFSPFTLASGNGNNPLPVTLVSFTAKLLSGEVQLDWNTASEIDNDYFTVEKTKDTKKYAEVLRVKGAGTSSMASQYGGVDKAPYSGISYYRLRQTDFDGKKVDIGIVAVNNSGGSETQTLLVFPNPARSVPLNVNLRGYGMHEDVTLDLRDVKGLSIFSKVLTTENTGELIYAVDTTTITPGVYILTVRGNHGPASVKVVVQ